MRFTPDAKVLVLVSTFVLPLAAGGCNLECDCGHSDVEDVVHDVGHEVRDTVKTIKEDHD